LAKLNDKKALFSHQKIFFSPTRPTRLWCGVFAFSYSFLSENSCFMTEKNSTVAKLRNIFGHTIIMLILSNMAIQEYISKKEVISYWSSFVLIYFVFFVYHLIFNLKIKEFIAEITFRAVSPYLLFVLFLITIITYKLFI